MTRCEAGGMMSRDCYDHLGAGGRESADPACPAGLDRGGHVELLLRPDQIDQADSAYWRPAEHARQLSAVVSTRFPEMWL